MLRLWDVEEGWVLVDAWVAGLREGGRVWLNYSAGCMTNAALAVITSIDADVFCFLRTATWPTTLRCSGMKPII